MPGNGASINLDRSGDRLVERVAALYREHFPSLPDSVASAPGRVNLIGEHTDYNEGFVLPMAIGLRTCVAIGPSEDGRWHFVTEHDPIPITHEQTQLGNEPDGNGRFWTAYPRGVIAGFLSRGYEIRPLCLAVASDVPVGAGLSSSAALEVAVASALEERLGVTLDPMDKVLLCQRAEHEFAGVPCGLMDQMVSVFSVPECALFVDCRTLEVQSVPLNETEVSMIVVDSGERHEHASGAYANRRAECIQAVEAIRVAGYTIEALRDATPEMLDAISGVAQRRARHVTTENARVMQFITALRTGDWKSAGACMNASHVSLRDDFEVSANPLDAIVDQLNADPGVFGARLTGGGHGGSVLALAKVSSCLDGFLARPCGGPRVERVS